MACPFFHKPEPCAQRQVWTTPAPSDCRACDFRGRKATSTEEKTPPMKPVSKPKTIHPKKEKPMPEKMTMRDKVLGIITRRGAAGNTPLLQGSKASAEELKVIVAALAKEGKIKSWPYRSRARMMALYTLPDAKDPRTKEMIEGRPTAPAKAPATPRIARATPPAAAPVSKPGPRTSIIVAAIADLEGRRDVIDHAIETLRALA